MRQWNSSASPVLNDRRLACPIPTTQPIYVHLPTSLGDETAGVCTHVRAYVRALQYEDTVYRCAHMRANISAYTRAHGQTGFTNLNDVSGLMARPAATLGTFVQGRAWRGQRTRKLGECA